MARGDGPKGKTAQEAFDDGDKVKTIKDHKRGTAANDHELPIDGKGGDDDELANFKPSGATIDELLASMETEDDEIEKLRERIASKTRPEKEKIAECRDRIKAAKDRLVGDGYQAEVLDVLMGARRDQRKAAKRAEQLDPANQKKLKAYQAVWDSFRETPLGQATETSENAVH